MSSPEIDTPDERQMQDPPSQAYEDVLSSSDHLSNGTAKSTPNLEDVVTDNGSIVKEKENGDTEFKPPTVENGVAISNGVNHDTTGGIVNSEKDEAVGTASATTNDKLEGGGNDDDDDDDDAIDDDGQSVKSEGADEEDALFSTLEHQVEEEEAAHPLEQPTDATAAPKLLQAALKQGEVQMDDSEHGEGTAVQQEKAKVESTKDGNSGGDDHIHHRVSEYGVFFFALNCFALHLTSHGTLWSSRPCLLVHPMDDCDATNVIFQFRTLSNHDLLA
jgi:hypothetical protein